MTNVAVGAMLDVPQPASHRDPKTVRGNVNTPEAAELDEEELASEITE